METVKCLNCNVLLYLKEKRYQVVEKVQSAISRGIFRDVICVWYPTSLQMPHVMTELPIAQDLRGYSVASTNCGELLQTTLLQSLSLNFVYDVFIQIPCSQL